MGEFSNQTQGLAMVSLTPSPEAPTVQDQTQQSFSLQQVQATDVEPRHKYKNTLYGLGISEVVFGSISLILGIATLIIAPHYAYSVLSQGIWCGVFLIATGILGIKAKNNPSVCMYNANMAMSIVTASAMVPLMVLSGAATALYSRYSYLQSLVALHSILVIVGFAAAVVCVVHSAYCCAGVCCCRTSYSGPVAYTPQPYAVQQPQQMVMLANGQYMMVPVQPGVPQSYPAMPNPVVSGQVVYQPPQSGVIMPQTTITDEAQFVHPTAVYPPLGSQQSVQDQTPAATAEAPPSYSLHQNEQDKIV